MPDIPRKNRGQTVAAIDVTYILAPGHSGSTLLGLLLGAHPLIATVGELKVVPSSFRSGELCSCGKRMDRCGFWQQVARCLSEKGLDMHSEGFQTHPRHNRSLAQRLIASQVRGPLWERARALAMRAWPGARRCRQHTVEHNAAIIRTILDITGRRLFLDTSKDASRLRYLDESGMFNIKVLHMIRDGRAVSYSLIRKGLDASQAARDWVFDHVQAERLRMKMNPDRWMEVRYEELCANADHTLFSVCRFLGVAPEQRTLDFRSGENHILGNRMRLTKVDRITLDVSWRSELVGGALAAVEAITGNLNRRYGYT